MLGKRWGGRRKQKIRREAKANESTVDNDYFLNTVN